MMQETDKIKLSMTSQHYIIVRLNRCTNHTIRSQLQLGALGIYFQQLPVVVVLLRLQKTPYLLNHKI